MLLTRIEIPNVELFSDDRLYICEISRNIVNGCGNCYQKQQRKNKIINRKCQRLKYPAIFFTFRQVLQYAIEIGGQNSIPLFAMSSIGTYRVWYKTVLDQLPDDYRRPLYRGIVQRNITMEEIRLLRKEVKRALLQLNALVNRLIN